MRLLVTGTGRCGTGWFASALTAAGVECGHERAFNATNHQTLGWVAEASWLAAPYLGDLDGDVYVVHLVRHPLTVVASRASKKTFRLKPRPTRHGRFAIRHAPEVGRYRTRVERSAAHYVAWTRMITQHGPGELVRLEDVTAGTVQRLARLVDPSARLETLPETTNGSRTAPPKVGWKALRHIPGFVDVAAEFGYREGKRR